MNAWTIIFVAPVIISTAIIGEVIASEFKTSCRGNIETGNREIIQAGVSYFLWYTISGTTSKIRFAGREIDAVVETGNSWKGRWIKRFDDDVYFSFLPDEGGTIKYRFEPNRWYSGNCE